MTLPSSVDLLVVGAGIVGLAHAYEGWRQGADVLVVDRATRVTGASVRNFGHACVTPQTGDAARYAETARTRWLELAARAGFTARECGTTVVARSPEELAVLEEHAATGTESRLLTTSEVRVALPVGPDVVGGAFLPRDLQVDPREAAPAIAAWLESVGVRFAWRTSVGAVTSGRVLTSRGEVGATEVVVAAGHDVDHLFPGLAEEAGVRRCHLHMLRTAAGAIRLPTPVLTGWSLLRYAGFAATEASTALRDALAAELPEGVELDVNLMYTTSPADGTLVVGDTHVRSAEPWPFQAERGFGFLLEQTARLFDVPLPPVVERWQGVYATAPDREFLIEHPEPGVHVVTVTTGIGMTTGLGIAPEVLGASAVATPHP